MTKKIIKTFSKKMLPACAFLAGFFYLFANKVLAANLEVQYPVIAGFAPQTTSTPLPDYVKYLFNAGMFIGFFAVSLSITIAGAMFVLSAAKADWRADAKDRFFGAISGLLIILLTYLIITTINPQLKFLTLTSLPPVTQTTTATKSPGVYFYKTASDCPDKDAELSTTSNVQAFDSTLINQINSVGIQPDAENGTTYITILYENTNLWGKCQYLTTTTSSASMECTSGKSSFASSASVHAYDFAPNGDGVYFFHKSCFNNQESNELSDLVTQCSDTDSGGYLEIKNSEIKSQGIYVGDLNQLEFQNVPEDEKPCNEYDNSGECTNRGTLFLGGENISSIIIKGDYIVVFVYKGVGDDAAGPWSSCQEFPLASDANKVGPQQIKWDNIRHNRAPIDGHPTAVIPNWVVIIPVQN